MRRYVVLALFSIVLASLAVSALGAEPRQADVPVDQNLVVVVADPHAAVDCVVRRPDPNGPPHKFDTTGNLVHFVDDVLAMNPRPAAVLMLGDLVETPTPDAYAKAKSIFARLTDAGIPVHMTPGNHDSSKRFLDTFPELREKTVANGSIAYRVELPSVDFITYESTDPHQGYYGWIPEDMKGWLKEQIRKNPQKPVFIFAHHSIEFEKHFPDIADFPNVQGWLNGHWHQFREVKMPKYPTVPFLYAPSVGFMDSGSRPITGYLIMKILPDQYRFTLITNDRSDERNGKTITWKKKTGGE